MAVVWPGRAGPRGHAVGEALVRRTNVGSRPREILCAVERAPHVQHVGETLESNPGPRCAGPPLIWGHGVSSR